MEYTYIFSIAGQVLNHLSPPIFQELTLVWGLSDDLRRLKNTISSVEAVLLDAQDRQTKNHQLKDWLEKLENALYRAQDVLEEFETYALRYKVCDQTLLRKIHREFSCSNQIIFRFKMAHKIKKIKEELTEIAADRNRFNLIEQLDERVVIHREMTHSFVREEDVIGRDDEREFVLSFLMATTNDESLSVLPIIGLGGMGKTTLAKLVFNDERVKAHFDLKIWVCVPEFEIESVIKAILKSAKVTIDFDKLQLEQLQQCLHEELAGRKYLLILDDVWNENHVKWVDLRNLLMGGASGSRIIITTRNQSATSIMGTNNHNVELQGLSHEHCLSLFLKWAFGSSEDASRHPRLVQIAESIVKKCKGVPLALRTLGSILYKNTDEHEWINVRDNEMWKIEQKEGDIMPALKLSYYQLPTNLRRCFASCSIFQKDFLFDSYNLPSFWLANGLLPRLGENESWLEAGMTYIKQLRSRGLFQDFEDLGGLVFFKMHDFLHDLALLVGGSDSMHLNSLKIQDCFSIKVVRHISFARHCFNVKDIPSWLLEQKENVRTVNFPNGVGDIKASFIKIFISKFKSLRWLDLNRSSFKVLPSSIGSLKHLKHLDLCGNNELKALPASICELVGLETLFFDKCLNIERLPRGLGQLIRLKRLGISTKESYLPENEFRCLTSLTHLYTSYCPNLKFVMSDDAMQCLSALRTLVIEGCGSLMSLPVKGLSRLTWFENLQIRDCGLLNFTMDNNNNSNNNETETVRSEEGFLSLRYLIVSGLPKLESLPLCLLTDVNIIELIGIGECDNLTNLMPESTLESLKSLQILWIEKCPKLKSLPEGIRCLTALNKVIIYECPELVSRGQRDIGEDWHKICHVPNIYLDNIKI